MFLSGAIHQEVSLRAAITKGSRQRCVDLTHSMTPAALERYLNYRIDRGQGTELAANRFRGLSPQSALILTHKVSRFYLITKRRTNEAVKRVD